MSTLEDILLPLCTAIKNETYKSKQVAFNIYLNSIITAKKNYSWDQIADYINTHTNSNITKKTYKTMLIRAKIKHDKTNIVEKEKMDSVTLKQEKPDIVNKFFASREDSAVKHDSTATMEKFKNKYL
ncbi:zinc transporter [Arsenophonus nasoniae]|uniref:zinc transporter n=1 Tax=Arsenophonus nasoniae TaxID=638 RepID=UPI00387971A4